MPFLLRSAVTIAHSDCAVALFAPVVSSIARVVVGFAIAHGGRTRTTSERQPVLFSIEDAIISFARIAIRSGQSHRTSHLPQLAQTRRRKHAKRTDYGRRSEERQFAIGCNQVASGGACS
jgi:hypothetical protein